MADFPPVPAPAAVWDRFTPATREWFARAFAAPTDAQLGAWDAISPGQHALVVAPTGSGKTLSAFLWALDGFLPPPITAPIPATANAKGPKNLTRVLYVSPL